MLFPTLHITSTFLSASLLFFFFFFFPCCVVCRILFPQPGIKPVSPALGAWGLNHWPPGKSAPFFTFKDLSDYSGPTQMIEDHLVILIISLTHNLNSPLPSPHLTILNWDQLQSPFQLMQWHMTDFWD